MCICFCLYRHACFAQMYTYAHQITQINSVRQLLCATKPCVWLLFDTPPLPFLPSPVFSCLPSLPVGQSEDRSDGSCSGSGAGAGPGESSVLSATDALGVFLLINGHRSSGGTRSPCRQWEVEDSSSADTEHLKSVSTMFTWRVCGCNSCDVGETD